MFRFPRETFDGFHSTGSRPVTSVNLQNWFGESLIAGVCLIEPVSLVKITGLFDIGRICADSPRQHLHSGK
jgi:hypothetical protein